MSIIWDFIIRLVDKSKIVPTANENTQMTHLLNLKAKQYLIHRKTKLIMLIIIQSIALITELVNLLKTDWPDNSLGTKLKILGAFSYISDVIQLLLVIYTLYYWNFHSKSINGSLAMGLYFLVIQNLFWWIPLKTIFNEYSLSITLLAIKLVSKYIISINIMRQIASRLNHILDEFPNLPECKVFLSGIYLIFVPIITYTLVIIFQLYNEPIIPFIWLFYLITIMHIWMDTNYIIVYNVIRIMLALAILIYIIVTYFDIVGELFIYTIQHIPNIAEKILNWIFQFYTSILLTSFLVEDMIINSLSYLRKSFENRDYTYYIYKLDYQMQDSIPFLLTQR
jgi:hypothetical protein